MSIEPKDVIGERHKNVVIVERIPSPLTGKSPYTFRAVCDYGHTFVTQYGPIKRGKYGSCTKCSDAGRTKHGKTRTPEHSAWVAMMARCYKEHHPYYQYYGERGITVCERWHDANNFFADMGERPTDGHSLDRIDNDGDYCPENCRWAIKTEQMNNRRNSRTLTFRGTTKPLAEWAREIGVTRHCLKRRVELGWSEEEIFSIPRLGRGGRKPTKQDTH